MSETMHDGGSHGGHSGVLHHGGGDSTSLGQMQGDHGHHQHGFLGHLLGLDHDHGNHGNHGAHSGHHHHHVGELSTTPQGSISWTSALRTVKLSDALQGINLTPNTLFLFMFMGFIAWLGVVYWIRHNEPLANHVLGTGAAHSATGHIDRHIVAGIRNAVPIRTGPTTGMVYVPNVPHNLPPLAPASGRLSMAPGAVVPQAAGAYHVPVHTPDGVRLKTVVNR